MPDLKILGIDPGVNVTGYGVIYIRENGEPELLGFGHIRTKSKQSLSERLQKIFVSLQQVIETYRPDCVAIEDLFYAENVKTAIVMGHARGAAIIAATNNQIPVSEFSPREVKMSVVGSGAAAKSQVRYMVKNLLAYTDAIEPDDASDALAVALCKWHRMNIDELKRKRD
jgi:crossover junction endodeoxyribonuclease RuvC